MPPAEQDARIRLRRTDENVDEVESLAREHGRTVGLAGVLAAFNRCGRRRPVPGLQVEWGFGWEDGDEQTSRWRPQGISTSADASDTEDVECRRLLVASWYATPGHGENHGSRVTFVDLETLEYRHVLLVEPVRRFGRVVMRPLVVHAGGLVWCGPYLHVAGTGRGIFTFRVDDIIEVQRGKELFGYRFVLPLRFAYAAAADGLEGLRYSFLSLDRSSSPPGLVAGEYAAGAPMTRRLVRYALDPQTFHLSAGQDAISRPVKIEDRGLGHMQGAVVVQGTWFVTTSRGRWRLGNLHVGEPGAFRVVRRALPVGPEDLSYWPSTDLLWSLSEYPGHRYVFGVRRSGLG